MRLTLALGVLAGCTDPAPAAKTGDSGAGDTVDTGGASADAAPCVTGALRSEGTIVLHGIVDHIDGNRPQEGVSVRLCGSGEAVTSDADGVWAVEGPDAEWVTLEASFDGTFPARWVYDPAVEGAGDIPFATDMVAPDYVAAFFGSVGQTLDTSRALVVIDALDPDTHEDLADVRLGTEPAGAGALTVSPEGQPILDDVTNGIHDVAIFNVPPGPVQVVAEALDGRTCAVAPPIQVDPGTVLGISTYCR